MEMRGQMRRGMEMETWRLKRWTAASRSERALL
jgi:hypothetical protein